MQDPYDTLRSRARSLLSTGINTGLSILSSVASNFNAADESSGDEEHVTQAETDYFVEKGARGILVFPTTSQKTGLRKMMHINLYKMHFVTYHDGNKRLHPCSDVISIYKVSETQVNVEMKGGRSKKIIFDKEGMADRFHMYIEFINEQGRAIRRAYHEIDIGRTGRITRSDLERALMRVDLVVDEEGLERMMQYGTQGFEYIDYYQFFHFFINSFVSNLRECLLEWLLQATTDESEIMTSQRLAKIVRLIPGEIISFMPPEKVHWCVSGGSKVGHNAVIFPGRICATNYRIIFLSSRKAPGLQQIGHSRYDIPRFFNMITMPLATIHKLYISAPRSSIYIVGKDYRCLRVTLSGAENNRGNAEAYLQMLQMIAFPPVPVATDISLVNQRSASVSGNDLSTANGSSLSNNNSNSNANASSAATDPETERIAKILSHLNVRPEGERSHFFAYHYSTQRSADDLSLGWNMADIIKEYERQGLVGSAVWRVVENKDYELSRSYPRYLALPRLLTPDQVKAAAAYRSQGRLPAITYRHRATDAVLTRAAQPLVGLTQKTCYEDTYLLDLYRTLGHPVAHVHSNTTTTSSATNTADNSAITHAGTGATSMRRASSTSSPSLSASNNSNNNTALGTKNPPQKKLYILDARGKLAATLNMAAGKGTEDVSQYHYTDLIFGNIDNIHTMRASAQQYAEALANKGSASSASQSSSAASASSTTTNLALHPHASLLDSMRSPDLAFLHMNTRLEDAGWLKHCRLLLLAASFAAEKIHLDRCSVLVHCSDGWDRTAQICSLTQVLLDPYYRTIEGLAALIEKDWCAFGHKFHERFGHGGEDKYLPDERSPVFLQFLDCLYQIMLQFPRAFEYTEDLLVFLADHAHSCLFGTFLGNTDEHRRYGRILGCLDETMSVWAYVLRRKHKFTHSSAQLQQVHGDAFYEPYSQPLWPSLNMFDIRVWKRYWCRWDVTAHPKPAFLSGVAGWQDDWGDLLGEEEELQALVSLALPRPLSPVPPVPPSSSSSSSYSITPPPKPTRSISNNNNSSSNKSLQFTSIAVSSTASSATSTATNAVDADAVDTDADGDVDADAAVVGAASAASLLQQQKKVPSSSLMHPLRSVQSFLQQAKKEKDEDGNDIDIGNGNGNSNCDKDEDDDEDDDDDDDAAAERLRETIMALDEEDDVY